MSEQRKNPPGAPTRSEEMDHEGQKSYAGQWGEEPRPQPDSSTRPQPESSRRAGHPTPDRPINEEDDPGEFDENLVGDKRPASE